MKKIDLILVVLVFIFGTTELWAQQQRRERPNPKKVLHLLDTDKDGKISKAEVERAPRKYEQAPRKYLYDNFEQIDQNKDKYIDLTELQNDDSRCNHSGHHAHKHGKHKCKNSRQNDCKKVKHRGHHSKHDCNYKRKNCN